jgi:hypothetical protein
MQKLTGELNSDIHGCVKAVGGLAGLGLWVACHIGSKV